MRPRRLRRSLLLALVTLCLTLPALHLTPAVAAPTSTSEAAGAEPRSTSAYPNRACGPQNEGEIYPEWEPDPGIWLYWECTYGANFAWWWELVGVGLGDDEDTDWRRYYQTGVWQSIVQSGAGYDSSGAGEFVGTYDLRGPSGSPIYRTMAVRLIVKINRSGSWDLCGDTGWVQAPTTTNKWQHELRYGSKTPCNQNGWYRVSAAGRFRSVSTGQWVTNAWVQSGSVYLAGT
jgi:hypothetical protein